MRSKYIFIITLIIFSFSGLLMAQFNLLSKEGREAAKKAAEEIKLLEEKHSALLKKNNYPMPVNVSKKFKKKSKLVEIVKKEKEEVKMSLKSFAKAVYIDPLKQTANIRKKNVATDINEYVEPTTYSLNRFEITGPVLTDFGHLLGAMYWTSKEQKAPKEKLKGVETGMIATGQSIEREKLADGSGDTYVVKGSTMIEGKVGTAFIEEADGLISERSVSESLDPDGKVTSSLEDNLHHISRPIVKSVDQEFSYEVKLKNKVQTECKCKSIYFLDNRVDAAGILGQAFSGGHSEWWKTVATVEKLDYYSQLNCSFSVDNVLYEFILTDMDRYPFFDGQIRRSSKKSSALYSIKQVLDTEWGKDIYHPPSRTFVVSDEDNTELLVTTSGLEVIPPEEPVKKLGFKSGFKMMKEMAVEQTKAIATGGDVENLDLSFMEKRINRKALHVSKDIGKKDELAFNLIGTVLSNFDLVNYPYIWYTSTRNEIGENLGLIPKYNPNAVERIASPSATETPTDGLGVSFGITIKNPDYIYWKKHLENN